MSSRPACGADDARAAAAARAHTRRRRPARARGHRLHAFRPPHHPRPLPRHRPGSRARPQGRDPLDPRRRCATRHHPPRGTHRPRDRRHALPLAHVAGQDDYPQDAGIPIVAGIGHYQIERLRDERLPIDSLAIELAARATPPGLDAHLLRILRQRFPHARASVETHATSFGVGRATFEQDSTLPWEVDEVRSALRHEEHGRARAHLGRTALPRGPV